MSAAGAVSEVAMEIMSKLLIAQHEYNDIVKAVQAKEAEMQEIQQSLQRKHQEYLIAKVERDGLKAVPEATE